VRSNVRATTAPTDAPDRPGHLRRVFDQIGDPGLLLYSSDFPHSYPRGTEELLAELAEHEARRILWENAQDTYRLPERVPLAG
jgi:predicted TIM-barrel fold metal-dependent hydrolase